VVSRCFVILIVLFRVRLHVRISVGGVSSHDSFCVCVVCGDRVLFR